ncbi:hypothetical protein [Acidaminococcus massiliensis]|jgi:hypothetical protein|nr:hypothetical protein [Acidaminococcus massiliensis]
MEASFAGIKIGVANKRVKRNAGIFGFGYTGINFFLFARFE